MGPCVTIFGSARFSEDHAYYALARRIGAKPTLLLTLVLIAVLFRVRARATAEELA